jgi:two-component system, NarL family, response regulator NreC
MGLETHFVYCLGISVKTVENHRQKIGEKLETQKRYDWVDIAKKYKLL